MSQQLTTHRVVSVKQNRHEFPPTSEQDGFFKLEFVIRDEDDNETTITILSDTEIRVENQS